MRDKNSGEARSLRMMLVREAVRRYNVIIATCVGSGHEMFDDVTFERVIIDECAQSIGEILFFFNNPNKRFIRVY